MFLIIFVPVRSFLTGDLSEYMFYRSKPKMWEGWFELKSPPVVNKKNVLRFHLKALFEERSGVNVLPYRVFFFSGGTYDCFGENAEIINTRKECLRSVRNSKTQEGREEFVCCEDDNLQSTLSLPCTEWVVNAQKGKLYVLEITFIPKAVGKGSFGFRFLGNYIHPTKGRNSFRGDLYVVGNDTTPLNKELLKEFTIKLKGKQRL